MMLQQDGDILNWLIRHLGGSGLDWLGSSTWAVVAVIIVGVWQYLGYYTLIFLAGLQGIPPDYYEAAAIDCAGNLVHALRITLPMFSTTPLFATFSLIIPHFQSFSQGVVLTHGGTA